MSDKAEMVMIILAVFVGALVVMVLVCVPLNYAVAHSCAVQAEKMGMPHTYSFFQGCMVEHAPGRWIGIDKYRVIE